MELGLLQKVRDSYRLTEILSTEKIEKGFLSENYKITTSDQDYFLKKYRFDDEKRIQEIHSVKLFFSEGGIPVIMPVLSQDGRTFFEHENFYFALFPFVSGLQPERGHLSNGMIISLGQTLGKMHILGKESTLEIKDVFSGWDKDKSLETIRLLQERLGHIEEKSPFDHLALETLNFKEGFIRKNVIKLTDFDLRNDHLLHGDYLDQNVFFDEQGNVKNVFDFEKTEIGPRTQELFRSATYSFLNTDFDETSVKNVRLYLSSYREIYPMEEKELREGLMAHYIKSMHTFWIEKEHYLKSSDRVDVFLEPHYKRLKFLAERKDDLLGQ